MTPYTRKVLTAITTAWLGLFVVVQVFGLTRTVELRALDFWQTARPANPDVVIIAIDNQSLSALGRWPWDRSLHATLVNNLAVAEARALVYDINFSEPQTVEADGRLATAVRDFKKPVVLAGLPVSRGNTEAVFNWPIAELRALPNVTVGHVATRVEPDGRVRYMARDVVVAGQSIPALARAVAEASGYQASDMPRQLIRFAGPAGTFPTISAVDVIQNKVDPADLKDKIVFIGATASDLQDQVLAPVPNQILPGVEWHANSFANLAENSAVTVVLGRYIMVLGLVIALIWLSLALFAPGLFTGAVAILVAVLLPVSSFIAWRFGFAVPWVTNFVLVAVLSLSQVLCVWWQTEAEKRRLRDTMQHYFSPAVMRHVLEQPELLKLGGQRREATIFFSDIRSFTTITESTDPEVLSQLLNEYFSAMTDEVFASDGVVDKFIGDAIMAFWGAPVEQPDHAERAVVSAWRMLRKLDVLRPQWEARGWPTVHIGIGINTGHVTVGNLGSHNRFDYTVIGDTVNAASRLEGLTKEYKTPLIISGTTAAKLPAGYVLRSLGGAMVKGKTVEIELFAVDDIPAEKK